MWNPFHPDTSVCLILPDFGVRFIHPTSCFLSLVVDEFVNDNLGNNRGIKPLPNLEFKFVAANSLIGLPKTDDLGMFEDRASIEALAKLRKEYFSSFGDRKKELVRDFERVQAKLAEHYRQHLYTLKKDLSGTSTLLRASEESKTQYLADWQPFKNVSSKWFEPTWMFGINGFDVVIANPPYLNAKMITEQSPLYRQQFIAAYGSYDIYVLFFEKAIRIMNDKGTLAFITSNKYLVADYGCKLRKYLLDNTKVTHLLDLADCRLVFDNVLVSPIITILTKERLVDYALKLALLSNDAALTMNELDFKSVGISRFKHAPSYIFDINIRDDSESILQKLHLDSVPLSKIASIRTGIMGFDYWNIEPFVKNGHKQQWMRIITNSHLDRYSFLFGKEINFFGKRFNEPYLNIDAAPINDNTKRLFLSEKIIVRGVAKKLTAQLDTSGYAILVAVNAFVSTDRRFDHRFLLALINSRLFNWYHLIKFYTARIPKGSLRYPVSFLNQIPIRLFSSHEISKIISLVDTILAITNGEDHLTNQVQQTRVRELERQIDLLVYAIYGLTDEEVAVVEEREL
ncbi:MAG: Eco57I restriction-modification methylase domain-containing protein [Dehalogenimonas sp.]